MKSEITSYRTQLTVASWLAFAWCKLGGSPRLFSRWPKMADAMLIGSTRAARMNPAGSQSRPLSIWFYTMLGSHTFMTATDVALARALRQRGHRVSLVICDGVLPACENKAESNRDRWEFVCAKCSLRGGAMMAASGLEYHTVSALVQESYRGETDQFLRAFNFRPIIDSALFKYFRIGKLRRDETETEATVRLTQACELSARAAVAVANRAPDRVLMSHGVYSTWAPALEVFNRKKIPVAVYNKGKRRNTAVINWITDKMDWDVSAEWERVKDRSLNPVEKNAIDEYLKTRVTHRADALVYNFGSLEEREDLIRRLRLDPHKPIFVLYTNVLWDAASAEKEIAFENAVDWVMDTVRWFSGKTDRQLVVKIHPAEKVIGTSQPFAREIQNVFPQLPENVRVIEPNELINSWSVARIATAGLVHTSTPGMELPLEGIPCLLVSGVHYRGKGFTIDISSREEYFRMLEHWDDSAIDRARMKEYALRYAYLLFMRYHLDWGFLSEAAYGRFSHIIPGRLQSLSARATVEMVCDSIESKSAFLMPEVGAAGT